MKKIFLLLFMISSLLFEGFTQVAVAKLKFEDAETAYNAGDYIKAINKLAESENLFGKINSPILHLRILAQNKLFAQTGQIELGFELKRNCATFLKDYADIEALEEKYKEVYRINENLADVPASPEEAASLSDKKNKEYQAAKKKYMEVIERYSVAIGGRNNLLNVQAIEIEKSFEPIGYLEMNGQKLMIKKVKSIERVKEKEIFFYEQKPQGFASTVYISTPGTLEITTGRTKRKGDEIETSIWNENLNIFPELVPLSDKDSVAIEESIINGTKVYVLTKKNTTRTVKTIFHAQTGLKISESFMGFISNNGFQENEIKYNSYTEFAGVKLVDNYTLKLINTTPANKGQDDIFKGLNKQKMALVPKAGVYTLYNENITSPQLNVLKLNITKQAFNIKIDGVKINPVFKDKDLDF